MEAKNTDSMREMDNKSLNIISTFNFAIEWDMEMAIRTFQETVNKSKIQVSDENKASMLKQWRFKSEFIPYFPHETKLIILKDRMFLIPKEKNKPIKIIIA
jgi:hypothetical protein